MAFVCNPLWAFFPYRFALVLTGWVTQLDVLVHIWCNKFFPVSVVYIYFWIIILSYVLVLFNRWCFQFQSLTLIHSTLLSIHSQTNIGTFKTYILAFFLCSSEVEYGRQVILSLRDHAHLQLIQRNILHLFFLMRNGVPWPKRHFHL